MKRTLWVLAVGGFFVVMGISFCLSGAAGPPSKRELRSVEGNIEEVTIHIDQNVLGKEFRRHTVIRLQNGKGSFKYFAEQPRAKSFENYTPGEPVSLLVDDRFTTSDGMFEIWELKRSGRVVSTYESNEKKYPGESANWVTGLICVGIGVLVIKQNL